MADSSPTYEQIEEAANFIRETTTTKAKIAVITGAALGVMPKCCITGEEVTCSKIPHIGTCTDEECVDCPNVLHAGKVGNTQVISMTGRPQALQRTSLEKISTFIKIFKLMGIEVVILIAPAGALNPDYKVGDVMIIKDHINLIGLVGQNPLVGKNDERFGPRFLSVNQAYNENLRTIVIETLKETGYSGNIHEGVYVPITGPTFPTTAEKEYLRSLRGDAVGMYLTSEAILAKHCGLNVIAMCLITEEYSSPDVSNYENVVAVGEQILEGLNSCIEKLAEKLGQEFDLVPRAAEIDTQSIFTAGPCCKCSRKKKQ